MQDAHEFAAQFIDNLKEEVAKMKEEAEVQLDKEKVNPVVDNMEMEWEEMLVCQRCGVRTIKRKKEVGLFCSLGEDVAPTSLQDLIRSSAEPETIDRTCEAGSCSHGKAEQSRRMTSLPRVLLIYLKRTAWAPLKDGGEHEGKNVKVTRVVDIPPVLSLGSVRASKCRLPSTVHSDPLSTPPVGEPISPIKNLSINATPSSTMATPTKFKGKSTEELTKMSDADQEEYMMFKSMKESLPSDQAMEEDLQIKAAMEESIKVHTSPPAGSTEDAAASSYDADRQKTIEMSLREYDASTGAPSTEFPPLPAPKRSLSQLEISAELDSSLKTPVKGVKRQGISLDGDEAPSKRSRESDVRRPLTAIEEEEDLQRALELSRLTNSTPVTPVFKHNPDSGAYQAAAVQGHPKWQYRLHGVVRHLGSSPVAGHYIANVYRFDAGGWWRYDDSQVDQTNLERVIGGNGRAEGYIFTYVHQSQWDLWATTN